MLLAARRNIEASRLKRPHEATLVLADVIILLLDPTKKCVRESYRIMTKIIRNRIRFLVKTFYELCSLDQPFSLANSTIARWVNCLRSLSTEAAVNLALA
jgi:hypothetical protein